MFGGNSKATALFTGIVLNVVAENNNISFEELNHILEGNALKNKYRLQDSFF